MHIGFLTPEYPHPGTGGSGGIGTSIYNLARGLKRSGKKVTVFVSGRNSDDRFDDDGITIVTIKNIKLKGLSWWLTRKKIQRIINRSVNQDGVEIVEAPDWGGLSAFVKLRCPMVIRCNGSDTYFCHLENRRIKWQNKFLEGKALRSAQGIISVSDFTANVTSALFNIPKNNFTIISNGILVDLFTGSTQFEPDRILYFGTLIRKKGVLEIPLIFNQVIRKYPSATLVLAGGDSRDVISRQSTWAMMQSMFSEEAARKVQYLGVKPYAELVQEINRAHVCIFPSFSEAFPLSWIEAMACGKAIVASNIGWAKECIEDGKEGMLVDPKNHDGFSSSIVEVLTNSEKASALGRNARERAVRSFRAEVVAEKTLAYFETILANE